jgi:uncharacterized protein (UPF0335 family)
MKSIPLLLVALTLPLLAETPTPADPAPAPAKNNWKEVETQAKADPEVRSTWESLQPLRDKLKPVEAEMKKIQEELAPHKKAWQEAFNAKLKELAPDLDPAKDKARLAEFRKQVEADPTVQAAAEAMKPILEKMKPLEDQAKAIKAEIKPIETEAKKKLLEKMKELDASLSEQIDAELAKLQKQTAKKEEVRKAEPVTPESTP